MAELGQWNKDRYEIELRRLQNNQEKKRIALEKAKLRKREIELTINEEDATIFEMDVAVKNIQKEIDFCAKKIEEKTNG